MHQKSYQTIDPLIMETLQLNQKRIHHIFDILHGRDIHIQTDRSHVVQQQKKSNIPKISPIQYHKKVKSPRLDTSIIKNQKTHNPRVSSVKRLYSPSIKSQVSKVSKSPQKSQLKKIIESRKSAIIKQQKIISFKKQEQISDKRSQNLKSKNNRLYLDYGQSKRSKTHEINPKDMYRLQTQNLLSKLLYVQDIQNCQKQMRRLKRRYKHLQRFDREYYSRLNQADLLLI